jgi:hypothetical protein
MVDHSNVAFKEWAVVVDALGHGEQVLILRKGGIHEHHGQFQVEHREFWLFPTQFHEAERSVIASKRPALRELAAQARPGEVDLQYFAAAEAVHPLTDREAVRRLQGRHIWSEHVLEERFAFGRQPGLYALVVRVYALAQRVAVPVREHYGGCKSWIELDRPLATAELGPVLPDAEFTAQRETIVELLTSHAASSRAGA